MKFRKENIKLLLDNCYVEPSESYSYTNNKADLVSKNGEPLEIIKDISGIEFTHTQINSIRKLFVQLSPSDKKECKNYLVSFLKAGNNSDSSATALSALVHLGFFDEVLQKIKTDFINYSDEEFYVPLFNQLGEILKHEWSIFTQQQIDDFYSWVDETVEAKNELGEKMARLSSLYRKASVAIFSLWRKLNILKTKNLKQEIFLETSEEITSDEKALKLEFKRNNFPEYLSETLDKIDLKISTANDNFDFKDCMGLIRAFSESLFKHIAESLDPKEGKKINGMSSEEAAEFFIKKQLISANQRDLLVSLRHFLSNEGVHRLKSRPDDARLSRNMMIEVGLYLLLRLKDVKA